MKIGILTSGGDCPGLNAVIRGAVLKGVISHDAEFVGFRWGWKGVVERDLVPITRHDVRGLSKQGGTILGSSRTNPFDGEQAGPDNIRTLLEDEGIDAIIAIGGEGTLTAARRLVDEGGLPVIGVPKTIDNDLAATDYTFGFDTAVEIATEAIDRLRTTAESHNRCMVLEVMGRHVGWIALHSGMAGGAHAILIPEQPMSIEEITTVDSVRERGRAPLIVVAEGFKLDTMEEALPPRPRRVQLSAARRHRRETRADHRGANRHRVASHGAGTHPARRRPVGVRPRLATRPRHGRRRRRGRSAPWGSMVTLRGTDIARVTIAEATGGLNRVPQSRYDEAEDPLRLSR